jgi:hypothetical protein
MGMKNRQRHSRRQQLCIDFGMRYRHAFLGGEIDEVERPFNTGRPDRRQSNPHGAHIHRRAKEEVQ